MVTVQCDPEPLAPDPPPPPFSMYSSSSGLSWSEDRRLSPARICPSLFLTVLTYIPAMMTVRRMMEADTAPRITKREGETDERSTDLVGSDSSSLDRGSETVQI